MPPFSYKRITDLLLPSSFSDAVALHSSSSYTCSKLLEDVETGKVTGCIKTSNQRAKSRGGILLYRGRCVGCVRIAHDSPLPLPTSDSIKLILQDLNDADTTFTLFLMKEPIIRAYSSLFLGHLVDQEPMGEPPLLYFHRVRKCYERDSSTGTIVLMTEAAETYIFLFDRGDFVGAYSVSGQLLLRLPKDITPLLDNSAFSGSDGSVLSDPLPEEYGYIMSEFTK